MPSTVAPNGNPDSYFIREVRRILRDQPAWFTDSIPTDGTNGVTTAGAKPFRLQRAPLSFTSVGTGTGTVYAFPVISAPSPTNWGVVSWVSVLDLTGITPQQSLLTSDGGAGGTIAAGTYVGFYTFVYPNGESGPSPLSTSLTIVANRKITINAITQIPNTVTFVNIYIFSTSVGGSFITASFAVTNNVTVTTSLTTPNGAPPYAPVLVMTDSGEIIFPGVPVSGTLSATYQSFRYSDQQILDALTEGLKSLWPEIWQENTDNSLTPAPYLFEYTLPAVFNDPRVAILSVEIRDPNIFVLPYKEVSRYTRPSLNTLFLADLAYSPAGNIRITYNAPYNALSDTEVQVQHLPVYFALGRLLADQEAMRSRQDELVPLTGEGSSQSGTAQQTSSYWFSLYEREKARFARYLPAAATKYFKHWSYPA